MLNSSSFRHLFIIAQVDSVVEVEEVVVDLAAVVVEAEEGLQEVVVVIVVEVEDVEGEEGAAEEEGVVE